MKLTNLKTNYLGKKIQYFRKIDSTQEEIWRKIENNTIQNGEIVLADIQTNGKGTHGRIWHTDEESNIAFSFYVDVNCDSKKLEGITIEIAKIFTKIFKEKYDIKVDIKDPNDLILNNKKIGGILTESKVYSNITKFLVIGIGINTCKNKFTEDIKEIATSIEKEYQLKIDRVEVITEFCNRFEKIFNERIGR